MVTLDCRVADKDEEEVDEVPRFDQDRLEANNELRKRSTVVHATESQKRTS